MGKLEENNKINKTAMPSNEGMAVVLPSPLQYLDVLFSSLGNIELYIKRDDLIHSIVSGNKYRKLLYNIIEFNKGDFDSVVTLGGAFSNHLSATAYYCNTNRIKCTALVKYHRIDLSNPTLRFCADQGMELIPIGRQWNEIRISKYCTERKAYYIPEGGSNAEGIKGMKQLIDEIYGEIDPDYIITSIGRGGTLVGIRKYASLSTKVIGISSFDTQRINDMLEQQFDVQSSDFIVRQEKNLGSFGACPESLVEYAIKFYKETKIPLDPIYTTKTMYHIEHELVKSEIEEGSKVVVIHTGGLQGWKGMQWRFPDMEMPGFVGEFKFL